MVIDQARGDKFQSGKIPERVIESQPLTAVRESSILWTNFVQQNTLDEEYVIIESLRKDPNVNNRSDKI